MKTTELKKFMWRAVFESEEVQTLSDAEIEFYEALETAVIIYEMEKATRRANARGRNGSTRWLTE